MSGVTNLSYIWMRAQSKHMSLYSLLESMFKTLWLIPIHEFAQPRFTKEFPHFQALMKYSAQWKQNVFSYWFKIAQ